MRSLRLLVSITLALALAAPAAFAGEPTAQLSPSRITLDEAATLRIAADDGRPPAPPTVDGLRFRQAGQRTEMSIMNGVVSRHTWVEYEVAATRAGTYTIPVGGQALQLEVATSGARGTTRMPTQGGFADATSVDDGALAFMRVVLPSHKAYVGQSVPITFKAYFRAGTEVTLTAAPSLGIPAFTISQLSDQPHQSVETIGGVPYRVATWTGQLAAAMPGHYISNATLPIIARYREVSRRPAADPLAGMLDDQDPFNGSSLLQSFMNRSSFGSDLFGEMRQRELTLHAHPQALEVAPLPTAGQPADYSGAVGKFDLRATLASTTASTFEPMSLKLEISGRGNLDRVSTSGVHATPDWKTYPPSAGVISNGSKVFEQAVVPQTAGRVELPAVSFSFFDPERGQYVTRSSAPIAVQVTQTVASAPVATTPASPAPAVSASTQLRPDHPDAAPYARTLDSLFPRPLFWLGLAAPLLALAFLLWRGKDATPSARASRHATERAMAAQRAEMRRAASANDPARYFAVARASLQARLGERWHLAPDDVTSAEVDRRMGEAGAPISGALRTAEHLLYAGVVPEVGSLASYDNAIEQQLDRLQA